jgi:anti-anti-sigma factor
LPKEVVVLEKKVRSPQEIELTVTGALSGTEAEEFQRVLQGLAGESHKVITLNLSGVPSVSSSCIGKMLMVRKALARDDRTLRIRGCSAALFNTFQLVKFDRLLSIER